MPKRGRSMLMNGLFGNHRTFVMGILGVFAGITGTAAALSNDARVLEILAFVGIGILGLILTVGYVVAYSKRPRTRNGPADGTIRGAPWTKWFRRSRPAALRHHLTKPYWPWGRRRVFAKAAIGGPRTADAPNLCTGQRGPVKPWHCC